MICERGGCPGAGGNNPHPFYALALMIPVVLLFVAGEYFGFLSH